MKKIKITTKKIFSAIMFVMAAVMTSNSFALPASQYASSSLLSSGKWVKIKVSKPGMQFVSNSQLTTMGFTDPSKVNVYGYGGRIINETLNDTHPDDLPLLPVKRVSNGLIFFGVDYMRWETATNGSNYTHTMQPYAEASYYFLSDREIEGADLPELDLRTSNGLPVADSFIERLVHEEDTYAPMESGRTLLGEDLRSGKLQVNFPLPDNVGGDAAVKVAIGSNITGNAGTLRLTTTSGSLSQNSFSVDAVRSSEQYMRANSYNLTVSNVGDALNLNFSLSASGVLKFANLDYVEVEYERALSLPSDQLYFYFNERTDIEARIKGITAETEIWDVTSGHEPKTVKFSRNGSEASFLVESGYHEYVAFNPSKVSTPVVSAGEVENQDIHAMESPDMLIISPEEYITAARRIATMHEEQDGMTVHVLTPEKIYNEFSSGTPDLSAFRKAMKMWYDRDMESGSQKLKYCLIMSRPSYDNKMATKAVVEAGYPRIPIWQSTTGYTENTSYSTDDFIGMLEDNSGSLRMGSSKINVAVGRFPVRSLEEANRAVDKLIAYTTNPERGSWRNNVMLIADDQDKGQHLEQTEKLYSSLIESNKGKDYQYERLYLDNFEQQHTSVGLEYPEAKRRMLSKFDEGQALITYIGHANTVAWTHEHLLSWAEITNFSNTRLPVLYAATCEFARWDTDEYSGAEVMWALPKTGVIAMMCPSRSVFISMNGPLSAQFGKYALTRNDDGTPVRLGDSYVRTKNGISGSDDNKLRYALIGDPAMKMPVYDYNVDVTEIYDTDVTNPEEELPVIEARSNPVIKGKITDADGNIAADFNGHVFLKLYDAEKVVETKGNGAEGKVVIYNDRKTKLYEGVAKVENGEWETTVFMPTEIENNFTTGRLTLYALADDGREGNGSTEKFHVYGYNPNAREDNEGPEIISFFLNHEGFKDGDLSYKTPVAYASFSDESGINLSEAGIGHSLMMTLDGKVIFNDVLDFYSPDLEDNRKGSFVYQLPEITAGKHTLTLSVWDCANNSSYATLNFNVAAVKTPSIYDIATSINADRSGVEFIISSDRPLASLQCNMEVFDINGVRVWHDYSDDRTDSSSAIKMNWDYTTAAGNKVAKGIYICRATVISPEGKTATKSKKIIVSE